MATRRWQAIPHGNKSFPGQLHGCQGATVRLVVAKNNEKTQRKGISAPDVASVASPRDLYIHVHIIYIYIYNYICIHIVIICVYIILAVWMCHPDRNMGV